MRVARSTMPAAARRWGPKRRNWLKCEVARRLSSRATAAGLSARLAVLSGQLRAAYDTRPVSQAEWDVASGDQGGSASASV